MGAAGPSRLPLPPQQQLQQPQCSDGWPTHSPSRPDGVARNLFKNVGVGACLNGCAAARHLTAGTQRTVSSKPAAERHYSQKSGSGRCQPFGSAASVLLVGCCLLPLLCLLCGVCCCFRREVEAA